MHRDVKLNNIMLKKNTTLEGICAKSFDLENVVIIDFGLAMPYADLLGRHVAQQKVAYRSGNYHFMSLN